MIAGSQIEGHEVLGLPQSVQQIVNSWQRVSVSDCLFVQCAVVNTHAPAPILLWHKKNWGSVWTLQRAGVPLSEQVVNLSLQLIVLLGTEVIRWLVWRNSPFLDFDFKFDLLFWRSALWELF